MSTTSTGVAADLTPEEQELQGRAHELVERVLMPLELEAEQASGRLSSETVAAVKQAAIDARLHGGRVPRELGGQGWSMREWFLVNEQFGRVTNGLHWHVPNVYNVWAEASAEQATRYVVPALRGDGGDAYAVTEPEAGSDSAGVASTAVPFTCGVRV